MMSKAHALSLWVADSIGLACLAGQFYIHQYNNVIIFRVFILRIIIIFQAAIGHLHIGTSVIALLAYFSRREFLISIIGFVISLISSASIMIGGMVIKSGGILPIVGSGLFIAAKLFNRFV